MKIAIAYIAILLAGACTATTEDEQREEAPSEVPAGEAFAATMMTPGTYDVGDGTTVYNRTVLSADGTYADYDGDERVGGGTWRTEGKLGCFDPEGDGKDQQERCWTNGPPAADGSFVTTRDDGSESYTVTPVGG